MWNMCCLLSWFGYIIFIIAKKNVFRPSFDSCHTIEILPVQDSMYIVVRNIVEICKELCSLLGNEDNSAGFRWNNSDILNHLVICNNNTTLLFCAWLKIFATSLSISPIALIYLPSNSNNSYQYINISSAKQVVT